MKFIGISSGGQLVAFGGGVRYLASMGAKPGNTSGGQPVVFGQKHMRSINLWSALLSIQIVKQPSYICCWVK